MFKYSLNIGALIGIGLILVEFVSILMGQNNNNIIDVIGYVVLALGLVYGIKTYRDSVLVGFMNYGEGVKLGLYISLAASFLIAVFSYLYLTYGDSSIVENVFKEASDEIYADEKLSDEEVEMSVNIARKFITPGFISFFALIGQTILGLIFSLIISAFLKNPEPMFEDES